MQIFRLLFPSWIILWMQSIPPPPAEPEKKSGRKKIDRGKVLALHRAGWSNKKIADEMACSEASVSMILKEEK